MLANLAGDGFITPPPNPAEEPVRHPAGPVRPTR